MKNPYNKFAREFLPEKIEYLLIGESPPESSPNAEELRYLYNYKDDRGNQSLLSNISYAFFEKKFFTQTNNKKDYLEKIAKEQIYLIDAVHEPINQIQSNRERKDIISKNYPSLRKSIRNLPLKQNVKIFLIHNNVIAAIGDKIRHDFKKYSVHSIGYPRCFHDPEFRRKIQNVVNSITSETGDNTEIDEIQLSSFSGDQQYILYKILAFQKFCPGKFLLSDPWPYEILNDVELKEFKNNLIDLMPLDTIITDLWDWDIRFEDLTFEDRIFSIAFGPNPEVVDGARALTEDMLGWINEYDMDYAQDEYQNHEFEKWIYEEALNFLQKWRKNIYNKLV